MSEPANFANWTRRDSWRLWEAVVLIGDMEPFPNFLEHLLESQRPNADAMRWRDIIDAARNSCESRDAPWFLGRCDVNRRQFLETPVHPEGFVQWALGKGFAVADELQSWRQRIDSRRAEETDRARLDELAESDPAGRTVRRRAAEKIGLSCLSCWLTAEEIAEIYGDEGLARDIDEDLSRRRLQYCVIRGRATMRDQDLRTGIGRIARNPDGTIYHVGPGCDGLCVHVADFLAWPARPPTPEGKAGELVRAWLGMAVTEAATALEAVPAKDKAKRRATREDALHPFIDEAVREWRSKHNGGWPLPADVLRILHRDYANGSDCGTISRVTEDGIEWRPPTATAEKSHGGEALRKRLERMRQKFRNAAQSRTDDMDDCA